MDKLFQFDGLHDGTSSGFRPRRGVCPPSSMCANRHRYAPSPELPCLFLEPPGYRRAAVRAVPFGSEAVLEDLMPVTHDQRRGAGRAGGGAAFRIVNISSIDIADALAQSDGAGAFEGRRRRGGQV